ncbi:MAG: hypothetical protein ACKV2V_21205 [Blastocatellia bacterium]
MRKARFDSTSSAFSAGRWSAAALLLCLLHINAAPQQLPGTTLLTGTADLAMEMVAGIGHFAFRETQAAIARRATYWRQDFTSPERYTQSIAENRARFLRYIGVVDARVDNVQMELPATVDQTAIAGRVDAWTAMRVRWPVLPGVYGEGLLLHPQGVARAFVIAMGDADQTPEMLAGLAPGISAASQFARRLVEQGVEVLIPTLIDRADTWSGNPALGLLTNQPHREFIYRMAYEMGRHIIGYEVQKVMAAVDWARARDPQMPLGVMGYGEGGLIAFYSAAADTRIDAACVSGYFAAREGLSAEPIYRNVWRLLEEFGDAGIAALIAPRPLLIEMSRVPDINGPPAPRDKRRKSAAPGRLITPTPESVESEYQRARAVYQRLGQTNAIQLSGAADGAPGQDITLGAFLTALRIKVPLRAAGPAPTQAASDPAARMQRQVSELVVHTQMLLRLSETRRAEFMRELTTAAPANRPAIAEKLRAYFHDEVIGRLPAATLPMNARSRLVYDEPRWQGYDITLDVWPDVFAMGVLLVPKDLRPGERRPVVVCQHGLEGRPRDVADPRINGIYRSFAAQLADRGLITFAPQNPYLGGDRFRFLQRQLNPLGKSLFSVIVRQHERILEWLGALPYVDARRIGFYGLSYGGKTAMRVPAILPGYALSICSGDFNEWIVKNVSVDQANSYVFTGEYEMPEFNLGNTFNYAEMAALIAPRPFMVERGHADGVGIDELVAYEYAKVRRMYVRMGVADKTEIEFFDGAHRINGVASFAFLARHLRWPDGPAETK